MKRKILLLIPFLAVVNACDNGVNKADAQYLRITKGPNKTEYFAGENFDPTGMEVVFHDFDGSETPVEEIEVINGNNLGLDSSIEIKGAGLKQYVNGIDILNALKINLTCVGDSLTAGHNWPTESYPNYIKDYLVEDSTITVSNCGHNGASFKTFGQYNPAYNTCSEYTTSKTGNPQVLTILLGTNDSTNWANEKDDFVEDYTNLVNEYREIFGEDLKIIMITPPRCTTNTYGITNDIICNEIYSHLQDISYDLDLPLIDLHETFEEYTDAQLFRDGVHLTQMAAKLVAKEIAYTIQDLYAIDYEAE